MNIYIVGTGVECGKTLTAEAKKIIDSSEILIGSGRILENLIKSEKKCFKSYNPTEICDIIKSYRERGAESCAVLVSGDCGFFSGAGGVMKTLDENKIEYKVVNGISSAVYLCGVAGVSWERIKFLSLHGVESNVAVNVKLNRNCFFTLGNSLDAGRVCKILSEYSLGESHVCVGENLGYENEKITRGRACELVNIITEKLCSILVTNENFLSGVPFINDSDFLREKIPMTKSETRCIAVSWLNIAKDSICWDLGCGTGAVSVEMAYRCPDGAVYSIDKNPDAVDLTKKNAVKFSCDNIHVSECRLPEIPKNLPVPDRVFIGGGGECVPNMIKKIFEINSLAEIVLTAVTLETLWGVCEYLKKSGFKYRIVQNAVTELNNVNAKYTMFSAKNPVFIVHIRGGNFNI